MGQIIITKAGELKTLDILKKYTEPRGYLYSPEHTINLSVFYCFSLFTFTVFNSCFKFYMNMNMNMNMNITAATVDIGGPERAGITAIEPPLPRTNRLAFKQYCIIELLLM